MAADAMECLGIGRGEFVVKVSNRKLLDGIMDAVGLTNSSDAARRLTVLRAIDKADRLGLDGVRALLGQGRVDESGEWSREVVTQRKPVLVVICERKDAFVWAILVWKKLA